MKQHISVLVFCAVSLICPIVVQAQSLTPSYLSEMPAPARVVNEIKGKNAADSGARQLGSFHALTKMIYDMAYGLEHRSERQLTPDEQRITQVYEKAFMDLWHKVKDTYGTQYSGEYDIDRDLLVELLDKFFSPNFRAQYFKTNGFAAAWYRKVHANGATSGTTSASPTADSANSPPVRPAAGIDPSIAKARAANVDTKVYGLQMGEPLQLRNCPPNADVTATCFTEGDAFSEEAASVVVSIFGSAPAERNPHEEWKFVNIPEGPQLGVLLRDGLLSAVKIDTNGINDVDRRVKDLREKYGPPTVVKPVTYTSKNGNALKASDLEWRLPGLHVEYTAVIKRANSVEVANIDAGVIYVETETEYKRRLAKENEQEKKRTKM